MSPSNFDHLKCIWMSSGIVDYKLCDKNFDCENCEFDKVLQKPSLVKLPVEKISPSQLVFNELNKKINEEIESPDMKLLYNNLILRRLSQNSYFLGFTRFLWAYLEPISSISCDIVRGYVCKGDPLMTISGQWGKIAIESPFDLYILSCLVNEKSKLQNECWLCLVEAEEESIKKHSITTENYAQIASNQANIITQEFNQFDSVGTTLYDGGRPLSFLHQILGNQKYIHFLNELLMTKSVK